LSSVNCFINSDRITIVGDRVAVARRLGHPSESATAGPDLGGADNFVGCGSGVLMAISFVAACLTVMG